MESSTLSFSDDVDIKFFKTPEHESDLKDCHWVNKEEAIIIPTFLENDENVTKTITYENYKDFDLNILE